MPTKEHFIGVLVLHGFKVVQSGDVWLFGINPDNPLITKNKKVVLGKTGDV